MIIINNIAQIIIELKLERVPILEISADELFYIGEM